jgi:hypothetical protein
MEILQKEIDHITKLKDFKGEGDKAFFSVNWLVEQFLDFTASELEENRKMLLRETEEAAAGAEEAEAEEAAGETPAEEEATAAEETAEEETVE